MLVPVSVLWPSLLKLEALLTSRDQPFRSSSKSIGQSQRKPLGKSEGVKLRGFSQFLVELLAVCSFSVVGA
jgi:hypothetical protein